ncbi:hypothetical protein Ddye_012488 [Dipteronia dyeriana]|uniref:SWIM-type domain-containing protein n=1 Tax=Dipteronia dyeriana TaxID=168575 RepID=A0AAE0CIQ3_9ROSI|nr:hypothetical protein Ddye_012488 [Dipteronia dyeriana]
MVRFYEKWDEVEKFNDSIKPYARETLVTNEYEAKKLQVIHGRGEWYKTVKKYSKKFLVNVSNVTCDCGMWQINGLPCKHATIVFMYRREFAQDHVHWYYSKKAWRTTYSGNINPIPEELRWPEIQSKIIEAGRPKKNRRRAIDEPRAPGPTFSKRCSTCQEIGHNSRTCPTKGKQSISKGKKALKNRTNASARTSSRAQTNECSTTMPPPTLVADVCSQIGSHPKP